MEPNLVYGPVPSRRLGRSLGLDLVPFKTCTYDCIYCQLGRTTNKTTERRCYVPIDLALGQLSERLKSGPPPDFIGLAGSGEPTLHSGIGEIIDGIQRMTDVPIAVLTNGALLWNPDVQRSLSNADLVLPSLDAGTPEMFQRVNRPHPAISFEQMVEGLAEFTHGFQGRVDLEVFVLSGLTDQKEEMTRIAKLTERIRPSRVQLNTASRPPAEEYAVSVETSRLESLCGLFKIPCEIIAEHGPAPQTTSMEPQDSDERILSLLERRPCTVLGIATGLGLAPNDVIKHLEWLEKNGKIRRERRDDSLFYEGTKGRPLQGNDE